MIPRWVDSFTCIPFDWQGRRGVTCWGMVRVVLKRRCDVEVSPYGWVDPQDVAQVNQVMNEAVREAPWSEVEFGERQEFDVLRMRSLDLNAGDTHVGILVSPDHVLHTSASTGPIVEHWDRVMLQKTGLFRHEQLAHHVQVG